jgi:hypothetical protein
MYVYRGPEFEIYIRRKEKIFEIWSINLKSERPGLIAENGEENTFGSDVTSA